MESIDVSSCQALWLAVIEQAGRDLKAGDKSAQVFLESAWCDTVCDMAGLDAEWVRAHLADPPKAEAKGKKEKSVPLSSPAQLKAMARWRAAHPDYMRNYKKKRRQSC